MYTQFSTIFVKTLLLVRIVYNFHWLQLIPLSSKSTNRLLGDRFRTSLKQSELFKITDCRQSELRCYSVWETREKTEKIVREFFHNAL